MELEGRVIVVVGGGRGIGRAHALACVKAGAKVILDDVGCDVHGGGVDPEIAKEVAAEIREAGGFAIALDEDVGVPGGPARLIERTLRECGRVDGLIGAAGLVSDRTALKTEDGDLDRMLDVMVKGSFSLVRAAGRAMIDSGAGGSIALHTAPVAFFGAARQSGLSAAAGAITGLVRSAAIELRKHKVRVNAIAPTARTRTTEDLPLFRGIAPGSMTAEQIAPLGVFLMSDRSIEVSGEIVGAAGSRLYVLRSRETPGAFNEGWSAESIAAAWSEITKP